MQPDPKLVYLIPQFIQTYLSSQYDKAKTIFKNVDWPSTDNLKDASKAGWEDNDDTVDLYAWFGKDPEYYGTVGLAWVGGACNDYIKTSFNEYRNTPVATAMVRMSIFTGIFTAKFSNFQHKLEE